MGKMNKAGLSGLFWIYCQVFIVDVNDLERRDDLFLHKTHPIQRIQTTGMVVSVSTHSAYMKIRLDDGTGMLSCIYWLPDKANPPAISLGDLLMIRGRLGLFREEVQVTVDQYKVELDENAELLHWAQVLFLKRKIYDLPFKPDLDAFNLSVSDYCRNSKIPKHIIDKAKKYTPEELLIQNTAEIIMQRSPDSFLFDELLSNKAIVDEITG